MRRACHFGFLVSVVLALSSAPATHAASGFADPAFQQQWQQGEAVTPNFWGPLANARDGQQEAYKEASGGQRLAQYFDKGRMELTNGTVTNGLLAVELMSGMIQGGDAQFDRKFGPAIPIAGDEDNPGPTYASVGGGAKYLFDSTPNQSGGVTTITLTAAGQRMDSPLGASPGTTFAAYDDATKHNVTQAFAAFRAKVGIGAVGYAVTEPFGTTMKVGGMPKDLVVQVFQRRLLTYTASNPDPFRVEFGNIGKHYYQWRYEFANNPSGSQITIGKPPADSVQKSGSLTVNILAVTPMVQRGQGATLVATVMSGAQCMLQVTYQSGPATDVLLPGPRSADSGSIAWIWRVTQTTVPGPATAVVSCTSDGQSGTATTTFMITS